MKYFNFLLYLFSFAVFSTCGTKKNEQGRMKAEVDGMPLVGAWTSDINSKEPELTITDSTVSYDGATFNFDIEKNNLAVHMANGDERWYVTQLTSDTLVMLDNNGMKMIYARFLKTNNIDNLEGTIKTFEFWNDSLNQILKVTWINKEEIDILLTSTNEKRNCQQSINGRALLNNKNGEVEMDEDLNGDMYEVAEFIYGDSKCPMTIRISVDLNYATIHSVDCRADNSKTSCPRKSVSVLQVNN